MKTIVIKTMAIIAMLAFCGIPQKAISQENKVKKVKYLGHKYEGQVNKDKVPEGEGTMNIGGLIIKGKFEGTVVSDAEVYLENESDSYFCTTYSGKINYDKSNNVTLKATGKMAVCYFDLSARFEPKNSLKAYIELKEDKVVNIENFNPEELTISYIADYSLGESFRKINPPQITHNNTVKPSEIELVERKDPNRSYLAYDNLIVRKVKAFVDNPKDHIQPGLEEYKDNEGRVWEYRINKNQNRVKFKVTYPNGSYYYDDGIKNNFQINYSDGRQLFYDKELGFSIDNITFLELKDWKGASVFCEYINSFPPKYKLNTEFHKIFYVKNEGLGNNETKNSIEKNINALLTNANTLSNVLFRDMKETKLGEIIEGKFISQKEVDAKKDAAYAKAEKERLAKIAPYIKRFGFNPDGKLFGQLIKAGRSFKLLCDWFNYLRINNEDYVYFTLSIDHGTSKCYDMTQFMGFRNIGFIWVSGDKVTSVVWK